MNGVSRGHWDPASEAHVVTNRLRAKLESGEPAFGGWCALADSLAAEIVSNLDTDYVVVDMQHGVTPYSKLIGMLQGIGVGKATPLVRISTGAFGLAQRVLDAGAYGIIVPLVDSAEEAARAVRACRYPPAGNRSYGPIRSRMHAGSDPAAVNREILCFVQVETPNAVENLEDILTTPGLDGIYVGPADLAITHGLPLGREHDRIERMLATIADTCARSGVVAGIHALSGEAARRAVERGFSMTSVGSDALWLGAGYSKQLAIARGEAPKDSHGYY